MKQIKLTNRRNYNGVTGLLGLSYLLVFSPMLLAEDYPIELKNPGFEDIDSVDAELPADWQKQFSSPNEGNGQETIGGFKRDESQAHSGKASCYLRSDGPRYARVGQAVKLEQGAKYRLSVWVRFVEQSQADQIFIRIAGRSVNSERWKFIERLGPTASAGEWTQMSLEFTAPSDAREDATFTVETFYPGTPVEAWFDDVELIQLRN